MVPSAQSACLDLYADYNARARRLKRLPGWVQGAGGIPWRCLALINSGDYARVETPQVQSLPTRPPWR